MFLIKLKWTVGLALIVGVAGIGTTAMGWPVVNDATAVAQAPGTEQSPSPEAGDWVGKRVVTKLGTVLKAGPRLEDEAKPQASSTRSKYYVLRIYRVERASGPSLWLEAEGESVRGWAPFAQVVAYDQALDYATGAIRANPRDARAYDFRGCLWFDKEEYAKAIADYDEAIRLEPRHAETHRNRGNAWLSKKDFDKAIPDFSEAIRLDPKNAETHRNRGVAWFLAKDFDKAIADFSEAIRLDPEYPQAYSFRAGVWTQKKDFARAIADHDEAVRRDPKDPEAYNSRSSVWFEQGDLDRAIADLSEAIRLDPKRAYIHRNRAHAWRAKEDYSGAHPLGTRFECSDFDRR